VVLLVPFPGQGVSRAGVGHGECENCKNEEEKNKQKHHEKVHPQETRNSAPCTHHASKRHQQDEDPNNYDRPLQETNANRIVLLCQPDANSDDRE